MEIFGWTILGIFGALGFSLLILLALPYIISLIKTLSYRITKSIETRKVDIDARDKAKKIRDEKLREKENLLENRKLTLKLNKIQSKIDQTEKDIKLQEALKAVEQVEEPEVIEQTIDENYPIIDEQVDIELLNNKTEE